VSTISKPACLRLGVLLPCLLTVLALIVPALASAEGSPAIDLSVGAPTSVLYGANATVTLTAENPAKQPYGYNLSYRAVLPEGISFLAGSAHSSAGALEPQIIAGEPEAGETTLIFANVSDLSPASSNTLSFQVKHSTSHFTVGDSYTVQAGAYIAEAPRYLPKFSATGAPEGPSSTSYTGYATGSASSTITALEIAQSEESPQGEILRGVHDHQVTYKLTITNTSVGATGKVIVDDWLPADLEYLGCGGTGADHTTDAPTNPGSYEEYPGSGHLVVPEVGSGCLTPAGVETIETDPDPGEEDPTGVYTNVSWSLGTLAAGETRTIEFAAAVPLRENTTTWPAPAGEPTVASGDQAANLNNNSGKETTDGEPVITFAKAGGDYTETVPVSASDHLKRVAKDLTIEKSASAKTLAVGQVTTWTLTLHSSEYRYNTGVVVTDTVPDGLCPLSSTNLSNPTSSECEPDTAPSSPYFSAVEEVNGTWKLVWNKESDAALAEIPENGSTTITYSTRTRANYQHEHKASTPILADDTITNNVLAQATTNVVCGDDTDCSGSEKTHIDHERPLSEAIAAASSASQSAASPSIAKEIAKSGTGCLADEYTTSVPVFHPGDLVCWRLIASFPTTIETKGLDVTDFLPISDTFDEAFEENGEKGQARGTGDTLPGTTFNHSEASSSVPGGSIAWALPEEGHVTKEKQRFERVYATTAGLPHEASPGELQGNLMKFANVNTPGASFSYRAEAGYALQFPQLTLAKQIVEVGGHAIAPASTATVKQGEEVTFALTLVNKGKQEAEQADVRENLATGLTCAEVVSAGGGVCGEETVEGKVQAHITWGDMSMGGANIKVAAASEPTPGTLTPGEAKLEFTVLLPSALDPGDVLQDKAGVAEYKSATNNGGTFTYIPKENIEPLAHPESEANSEKAIGEAELKTEEAKLVKTHTTSVVETGNTAEQATIGEQVTYSVTATVPAGTTLNGVAKLTDPGFESSREEYETGSVEALVNGAGGPVATGFSTEVLAGKPVVVFPAGYGSSAGAATLVTMRFNAHVLNVEANYAGGTTTQKSIPNTGELSWTSALGVAEKLTAENSLPLTEPSITLTQTPSSGTKVHGGQVVEYSVKLKNAAGASTAFGNEVVDTVPTGLVLVNAKDEALKNGEATASGGVWNETARTITWKLEKLEGGKEQAYVFFVAVNESPVSSTLLKNTAIATTASLPSGVSSATRAAANAPSSAIKARYEAKTEANLEVEGATIAKTGSPEKATIGEKVTYTLTVKIPAYTVSYNQTVIDTLPSTLEFDKYTSAACTSGCAAGPTEIEPKPYTAENNVAAHTNRVAWYLGNVTSATALRELKLVYVAIVRSTPRGGGAEVKAPGPLENSASLYYNIADSGYAFNEAVVPPASFNKTVGPVHAKTTIVEPSVAVVKEASVSGGAFSATTPFAVTDGSTITYRLKVTNSGTAPAYNVSVTDALPASGLVEVKTVANAPITSHEAEVTQETASELAWTIPALGTVATPAKTITLEYTAKLAPVTTLTPGQEIANTAKVPTYFGVPAAERTGESYFHEAIAYRSYKGNEKTLKAKVALPTLTIEKLVGASGTATSANAEVNQPFTWRVLVKNTSTVAAKKLKVTDKLPANWEYVAGSAEFSGGHKEVPTEAGTLEPGRELTWSTSIELAAGASTTLTYQAKPALAAETNPGSGKAGVNSASATVLDAAENPEDAGGPFGAGPAQASGVLVVPTLTVSKTPAKASVAAGEADSYKIVVKNTGAGVAREVLVEDTLPAGMTYTAKSATASPATGFSEKSASGSSIVWEVASIAAGATVEITVPVGTEASLAEGTKLKNAVAVNAPAAPTPVKAEGTITLTTSAELSATKTVVGSAKAVPGEPLTYEVTATNKGPSLAREVELVDHLPAGLTYKSSSPVGCSEEAAGVLTCEAGNLEPGHTTAFQIEVELAPSLTGTISNTVIAESPTPDPKSKVEATSKVAVSPEADLALQKTAPASVITGEELTWTLTATNNGPSDANGVTVVDPLPAGTSYLKSTSSQGSCAQAAGTLTCKLGPLAYKAGATITITARVTAAPGPLTNTATVSGEEPDPEPANNEASATTTVLEPPSIAKASDGPEATIGHRITYTLTVTVPAGVATYNQTAIDTLPDSLDFDEYVSATCTSGCTTPETAIVPQTYTPKVLGATPFTTSVAWYLGNVTAAPTARTIVLVYRASVRATHRGSPADKVQAPAEIENNATLYYNQASKGSFEEANIPTPASFDQKTSPVSTSTKVVEPSLTLTKEASVDGGAFSATTPFAVTDGSTITYRLKVTNSGTAPAYNVSVTDALPASGLTEVSTIANAPITSHEAEVTQETASELAWTIPALGTPATPGKTITLEYHVKLAAVSTLKDGQTLTNTATIPFYFGVAESERKEGKENYAKEKILYREYKGPSAQLTATVALPAISIEKTTGAAGFPASANAEVGQPFTWRVLIKNTSTVAAKSLAIADTLPANWEYLAGSASFSAGDPTPAPPIESASKVTGTQLEWRTAIELAPGESTTLTYQAKPTVAAESAPGTGASHPNVNQASATVEDEAGNAADADGPFAAGPAHAEAVLIVPGLTVTKTPALTTVNAGDADSYEIVVHDAPSVGIAREVMVLDTLPAGMTYTPGSATSAAAGFSELSVVGSQVTWKIPVINPAESVEITVPVGTEPGVVSGSELTNTVAAHSVEQPTPVEGSGTIKITTSADVEAKKTIVAGGEAVPGRNMTYEVSATNNGPSVAREVKLVDTLPAGVSYVSSSVGCTDVGVTVTCSAGDLPVHQTAAFQIVTSLAPDLTAPFRNVVLAESPTPDPEPANNEAFIETTPHPVADLGLEKVALTPKINDGEDAVFRLTATNHGPSDASEVEIVDTLPQGLSFVSATNASCKLSEPAGKQVITCPLGELEAGHQARVEVSTKATEPGGHLNTATVTSPTEDTEPLNNEASAEVVVAPTADLQLTKNVPSEIVQLPGEVTYTLVATNAGPDTAKNVRITDELPAGETYVSNDGGCTVTGQTVTCGLGELPDGATRTIHLVVAVGVSLGEQEVINTARVSSETFDPNEANNSASAALHTGPTADVALEKTGPASVVSGTQIAWSLRVHNNGPSTAHEVTVEDQLPSGVTFTGATASQGEPCRESGGVLTCDLGTMSDGAQAEITVTATVTLASGSIVNTAVVHAIEPDPDPANNSSSATTTVLPAPATAATTATTTPGDTSGVDANSGSKRSTRVTLRKLVRERSVAPDGRLDYRLIVRNAGAAIAEDLRVCDAVPLHTTVVSRGGGRLAGGRICFTLSELAAAHSHSFAIVLRADSTARGEIVNRATVTGANFDSKHARVSTPVRGAGVSPRRESRVTG
jgi:large repetitive protein